MCRHFLLLLMRIENNAFSSLSLRSFMVIYSSAIHLPKFKFTCLLISAWGNLTIIFMHVMF